MTRWLIWVITLPGTSLVFVPALIVWFASDGSFAAAPAGPASIPFWLGLLVGVPAAALVLWSASMFSRFGEGTPAPWDPPTRLVVRGPYQYVRNPMLSGVIGMLIAESLILGSWPLAIYALAIAVGSMICFPLREEPVLHKRFGEDYRVYCQHVGRWFPRITPWRPPADNETAPR